MGPEKEKEKWAILTILSHDFLAGLKAEILESSFLLDQGVSKLGHQFLKTKPNWDTARPIHLHNAATFLPELSSCDRNCLAGKAYHSFYLVLQGRLLTPARTLDGHN